MRTFKEISTSYSQRHNANKAEQKRIADKIAMREKQLERLNKKSSRNWDAHPHWTDEFIRPIIDELKRRMPEIKDWDDDRFIPMGLRNAVSVFPKYKGLTLMIVFTPGDFEIGELKMENGELKIKPEAVYSKDTIGDVNGMNNVSVPIESIDQIVKHLKGQIKRGDK